LIAYVDSSVLLRIVLAQPNPLATWARIERAVTSELTRVECLRTIDRARLAGLLDDGEVASRRSGLLELLDGIELVGLEPPILDRAAEPFPTSLGTLYALHLASALAIRDHLPSLVLATHDRSLATAATAMAFEVQGTATAGRSDCGPR
jgi:predicted nucleic acid-binding protein